MEHFRRVQSPRREAAVPSTRSSVHRFPPGSIESPALPVSAAAPERAANAERAGRGRRALRWSIAHLPITHDEQETVRQDATSTPGTRSTPFEGNVFQRKPHELALHEQKPAELPTHLKTRLESLSGLSLDDVRVHYHSARPLRVGAAAYAQGRDIYIGPGQQEYLAHEVWHVVQQKQARVRPTWHGAGTAINDDRSLEYEADLMGTKGEQARGQAESSSAPAPSTAGQAVMQLMKLSALRNAEGFQQINKGGRLLDAGGGYHITVYANQATWDRVPMVNGRADFSQLKPDDFEFDALHVTSEGEGPGGKNKHFYYDAQGKPLQNYTVNYGEEEIQDSSPPWKDPDWEKANSIIAGQLGTDKYTIHKQFNIAAAGQKHLFESAEEELGNAKQQQQQMLSAHARLLAAKKKAQQKPLVRALQTPVLPANVPTPPTSTQETTLPQETVSPLPLMSASQASSLLANISTPPTSTQETTLPQETVSPPISESQAPSLLANVSAQPVFHVSPFTLVSNKKRKAEEKKK